LEGFQASKAGGRVFILLPGDKEGFVSSDQAQKEQTRAEFGKALKEKGWQLTHILTTHHHHDHTDGNLALKAETKCTIVGPRAEAAKVPGIDKQVGEGDTFTFGGHEVRVFDTPGHTAGHITYWLPADGVAFAGDTLFAIGCGRVIEGNAQMMWQSLQKLMALPKDTTVYCGHEYTQSNAKFALTVEPDNDALRERYAEVVEAREHGEATVPTTIGLERATNPFMRASSVNEFAERRHKKDIFKG